MRRAVIPALLLAASAGAVRAQTQVQLNERADAAYRRADLAMTRQWNATYATMKARDGRDRSRGGGFGYAAALLASQRAWLAFRDAQCVIEGGRYAGGSAQGMARLDCLAGLSQARTTQLRALDWQQ